MNLSETSVNLLTNTKVSFQPTVPQAIEEQLFAEMFERRFFGEMLILESVDRKVAAVTGLVCFHSRVNF